ncbi:MAG: hypothetical protein U5K69_30055 [Balneolaceae bacterium]|nr:hypothetical protein [Balneolaceae bacterium]
MSNASKDITSKTEAFIEDSKPKFEIDNVEFEGINRKKFAIRLHDKYVEAYNKNKLRAEADFSTLLSDLPEQRERMEHSLKTWVKACHKIIDEIYDSSKLEDERSKEDPRVTYGVPPHKPLFPSQDGFGNAKITVFQRPLREEVKILKEYIDNFFIENRKMMANYTES